MRNFERSATLLPSSPTLRKIPRGPLLAHNLLLCRLRRSKHRNELRISHDDRLLQFWEKKKNSTLSTFFPEFILFYFPDFFQVCKTGSPVSRRFQESKVAFDWKIWIYILKLLWICNRTDKTDFTSEKSVLNVDSELWNPNPDILHFFLYRLFGKSEKTDLQNCLVNSGLFSAIIMTARWRPLFSVEIRFQIKQSIENPKPGFQNLNPDFLIESSQL